MFLFIRMMLYAFFTTLANMGFGLFDPATGGFSFSIDNLAAVFAGVVGYLVTFLSSRVAKKNGGVT